MNKLPGIRNDVICAAQLSGAKYSEEVIDRVLESFSDKFTDQIVDFKTTTKPLSKRGFYFRYMEENERCRAWDRACQSGLLRNQGRPVDRLVPEIYEHFPLIADGIDFEANYGLAKIWQFIKEFLPIENAFKISSLPKSVITYSEFFKKYNLNFLRLFAADYQHNSMNIYFQVDHPDQKETYFYESILQSLNFQEPSDEILNNLIHTGEISMTFTWNSPTIERICFYTPGFTRHTASLQVNDSSIQEFIEKCPVLSHSPHLVPDFVLGFSFGKSGKSGTYVKIDVDYNAKTVPFFLKIHELSLSQACR